jgi:pimeloyl-ACP methyl ester carboxylesterase
VYQLILMLLAAATLLAPGAAIAEPGPPSAAAWYAGYAHDSRLVAIGNGRSLNLYCLGAGSPTVILESGLTEAAYNWWAVQGRIAKLTRVCAYDRAGMGRSPPGPFPRDTRAQVRDLEALLKAAGLKPPYVLVGHSAGGYNVRLFASRHPREVAGIVFVDSAVENQLAMEKQLPAVAANDKRGIEYLRSCADPERTRDTAAACKRTAPKDFPPDLVAQYESAFGLTYSRAVFSEVESFVNLDSREVIAESRRLGSIPLIVLTRGALSSNLPKDQAELEWKLWNGLHDNLARLSTAGVNRVVPGSGHYVHLDKPDAVVDAVTEVVTAARNHPRR